LVSTLTLGLRFRHHTLVELFCTPDELLPVRDSARTVTLSIIKK
jgi:hypothetical protein